MADEKKGGALGLLLLGAKPKAKAEEEEPSDPSADVKKLAAQGVLSAISEKDSDALAEALETFVSACKPAKD